MVGFNPSYADCFGLPSEGGDNTAHRVREIATGRGFDSVRMVNLFAMRSSDPSELFEMFALGQDPVGRENDRHIQNEAKDATRIVMAYGAISPPQKHPAHHVVIERRRKVYEVLQEYDLYRFGPPTKDGHPRHPSRKIWVPDDVELELHRRAAGRQ